MAVDEAGCVHFFGVFRNEAIDDEVIAIGTFDVDIGGGFRRNMSFRDNAWDVPNYGLGLRKTGEGANLV